MNPTNKLNQIASIKGGKTRIQKIRRHQPNHCSRDFDRLIGLAMEMEMIFDELGLELVVVEKN